MDNTIDTIILTFLEGFVYYSYDRANKAMMALDIQAFVFNKSNIEFLKFLISSE
jgi:hypothetical protein